MAERIGIRERMGAFFREHSAATARKLDMYLGEHMPDLVDKHKLATKTDFLEVDKLMAGFDRELDSLDTWREQTKTTVLDLNQRIKRLEHKYGLN